MGKTYIFPLCFDAQKWYLGFTYVISRFGINWLGTLGLLVQVNMGLPSIRCFAKVSGDSDTAVAGINHNTKQQPFQKEFLFIMRGHL